MIAGDPAPEKEHGILASSTEGFILVLALGLSGLFSAAETALMSINRAKLRTRLDEGDRAAKVIQALIQHPRHLLSTILTGNTLAMVTVVVFGTSLITRATHDWGAGSLGLAIAVLGLLIVTIGEIVPKSLAAAKADLVARLIARPIQVAMWVMRPLIAMALVVTTPLIRLFGAHEALAAPRYTEDELRMLLEIGQEQGVIEEDESDLVTSALAFDDTPVAAILTPRVDIVAVSIQIPLGELVELIAHEGYSRMPVYRESIDDIVGVLRARDALMAAARGRPFDLASHLHPVYFVPENKKLNDLLREMQAQEIQMAIVNDEYGGTAGLVTIEDILEQIVGEIRDESDEELEPVRPLGPGSAVVDAMAAIDQVNEELGTELPIDGYQTMGGLVLNRLGRVAKPGDIVELGSVRITVRSVKGIRIQQVTIDYPQGADEAPIREEA